jgi:hypothetical protein
MKPVHRRSPSVFHDRRIKNLASWPQPEKSVSPGQSSVDIGHSAAAPADERCRPPARVLTSPNKGERWVRCEHHSLPFFAGAAGNEAKAIGSGDGMRLALARGFFEFGCRFSADPADAGSEMLEWRPD